MTGANLTKPEADPFDLASLRLSQDFASAVGVKKLITTVPVKKPGTEREVGVSFEQEDGDTQEGRARW